MVKDKLALPLFASPPREGYMRAIGPKTVHAERTLHFLSPQEYKAAKAADREMRNKLGQQYGWSQDRRSRGRSLPGNKSALVITSVDFEQKR